MTYNAKDFARPSAWRTYAQTSCSVIMHLANVSAELTKTFARVRYNAGE